MGAALEAMLLTRVAVKADRLDPFDAWQRDKHLVELSRLDGIAAVSYYATRSVGPPLAARPANRMAAYWARDPVGLRRWLEDPGLETAVEDGTRFFGDFDELDGATYTGNIYSIESRSDPAVPSLAGSLLVERYEVAPLDIASFDAWVCEVRLPQLSALESVGWTGWGRGIELPTAVPYYDSPGNRLVLAEAATGCADDVFPRAVDVGREGWNGTVQYARREINEVLTVQIPAGQEASSWPS